MVPLTYQQGKYLIAPYREEDEQRFLEIALDNEVVKFMGGATGNAEEERKRFMKIFEVYQSDGKRWWWIWGVYRDGKLCAHIELKETEHTEQDELEIVYMVHPDERRKGIMNEVFKILKENQYSWKRSIIATVAPENKYSIAALQKWGIKEIQTLYDQETGERYLKMFLI